MCSTVQHQTVDSCDEGGGFCLFTPWLLSSQTWSSWRFSWRVWTGSYWCEAVAVKLSPFTLKEKKGKKTSCAPTLHTLAVAMDTGQRAFFGGRCPIWFWMAGRRLLDGGTTCDWHLSEGPHGRRKTVRVDWLRVRAQRASTLGHCTPCTWRIEHRDTLFHSFNSGKVVMFSLPYSHSFPLCVDVVESLALTS